MKDRRLKSQKGKPKSSDGRKNLSSVRVIQRKNLVYIIGIPSSLADEDLLQHKEYFGQYGKVMKVSMPRNAGGSIQYSATNTCSVYITYSKEEEAVRCIQSVHGYVLEDKPLKACFGTTKYCHAWLRNTSSSSLGKSSPPSVPIVSPGRSVSLPAAVSWGLRASNGRPPNISSDGSTGFTKQNSDGRAGEDFFSNNQRRISRHDRFNTNRREQTNVCRVRLAAASVIVCLLTNGYIGEKAMEDMDAMRLQSH
ncbi:general negative regulator of transcription subunit 4-like isoform X2 [Papaver somniferum]|uniref:general negative regulator of transcription subunit 4-like isoform X2 n=1 Tax=Papaver somniferum TaxID=3469 RepID=UPI000E6F6282|nr:general negative regulator of transcription subunit 4-like isoform X2 [Papaver somniferum]